MKLIIFRRPCNARFCGGLLLSNWRLIVTVALSSEFPFRHLCMYTVLIQDYLHSPWVFSLHLKYVIEYADFLKGHFNRIKEAISLVVYFSVYICIRLYVVSLYVCFSAMYLYFFACLSICQ